MTSHVGEWVKISQNQVVFYFFVWKRNRFWKLYFLFIVCILNIFLKMQIRFGNLKTLIIKKYIWFLFNITALNSVVNIWFWKNWQYLFLKSKFYNEKLKSKKVNWQVPSSSVLFYLYHVYKRNQNKCEKLIENRLDANLFFRNKFQI